MKKWLIPLAHVLLCIAMFVYFQTASVRHTYRFAICAMFKNEAAWLREWLAYHHEVLGAEHFYLYQNDSADHYAEVLAPYIQKGVVELIDWNSSDVHHRLDGPDMDAPWVTYQLGAYNDCLKNRAMGQAKWVAMIDIDEFIVPVNGVDSFYALLKGAEKEKCGSVRLLWRVFGTSHVRDLESEELLIEKMIFRNEDGHDWNALPKSIHRPEAIKFCMVHEAESLREGFSFKTISPEEARIHHYWSRTEKFCLGRRGVAHLEDLNRKEDTTILQYVPDLRKILN